MTNIFPASLTILLILALLPAAHGGAQQGKDGPDIYASYYSREDNYGKEAEGSGNSHYIKFYPENRIVRLYIPFPYSKSLKPDVINAVFDTAVKKTAKSAYIRDKFGLLDKPAVAHLDMVRRIDGEVMYDCGNATPCKVIFAGDSMTVIRPGVVMNREIFYERIDSH